MKRLLSILNEKKPLANLVALHAGWISFAGFGFGDL
jgi:hypothetical protein